MNKRAIRKHLTYLIPQLKLALIREKETEPIFIVTPCDLDPFLEPLRHATEEYFLAFHLDVRHRVIGFAEVSHGTLSSSLVHPREVFKTALLSNAHTIIVVHNHPSGSTNPSDEDIETTKQLIAAGKLLGVPILDHLIVSHEKLLSIRQMRQAIFD